MPCSFLLIEADGFSFGPRHGLRARLYETFVIFSLLFLLILFFFCLIVSTFWFWKFLKILENLRYFEIEIFPVVKTIFTQLMPQRGETKYTCRHDMTSHVTSKWPLSDSAWSVGIKNRITTVSIYVDICYKNTYRLKWQFSWLFLVHLMYPMDWASFPGLPLK